jgi:hypothetical protein
MSASTSKKPSVPASAPSAPATDTSAAALATANVETFEIDGKAVALANAFTVGQPMDADHVKILFAAYVRQFTNNQNAIGKARAERHAKATTAEEKAATAPRTAEEIAALFAGYKPQVGGGPRLGSLERLRLTAAWRAYVAMVTEHNTALRNGNKGVFATNGVVAVMRKGDQDAKRKAESLAAETADEFTARKESFLGKMLSMPKYADRIQAQLDLLQAENGKDKATAAVTTDDIL